MRLIDGNKSVYELIKENPELKEVLFDLGFTPLSDDKMLNTLGRMMPLKKGAQQIRLNNKRLSEGLEKAGFKLLE